MTANEAVKGEEERGEDTEGIQLDLKGSKKMSWVEVEGGKQGAVCIRRGRGLKYFTCIGNESKNVAFKRVENIRCIGIDSGDSEN